MNYILLETPEPLSEEQKEKWLNIIFKFLTNGTISQHKVFSQKTSKVYKYKVFLKKDITNTDAEYIVTAWDHYYDGDFEVSIKYDETHKSEISEYIIEEQLKEEICETLSKFLHNRWVDKKINEGWRYSGHYNLEEQTHPSLRDWNSLPEDYKKRIDFTNEQLIKIIESHPYLFS